ncbi:hypothetical protein OIU77_027582 [Salix suchowensis]|uniref:Pentatricopeptide repeat-containing protein n=1 Tax=Salix suchowensis TaxID=1278906 RepID=A0ABQ9BU17_9ROSI|nr:hypothetical protein OIU77_027582 [Salix suchowensis]
MSNSPIEGFLMYQEMREKGLRADPVSLSFVIKCYIRVCSLIGGEQVHARILSDGHQSDSLILTNLMDLYSLCDKGIEACKVFDEMPQRDTIAWNVLISCYMRNRRTRDVLIIFDGLLSGEFGCEPDDVTCLRLLQACSNLGALEFGEKVHGHIVERGIHRNVILGERVVEHLIELKAQEAGDYVLLFNLYSSVGNWEKVTELRKFMKEKGIQTTPASSSIELKGIMVTWGGSISENYTGETELLDIMQELTKLTRARDKQYSI